MYGRFRESRWQLSCAHRGGWYEYSLKVSVFLPFGSKFPCLYNIPGSILMVTPPTCKMHVIMLPSIMPPRDFYVPFPQGNTCVYVYFKSQVNFQIFPVSDFFCSMPTKQFKRHFREENLRPDYLRYQEHFLLFLFQCPISAYASTCQRDLQVNIQHNHHHHHHHVVLPERISLTLSSHPSLSPIAPDWSSRLHPVSA